MGRWSRAHTAHRPPDRRRLEAVAQAAFARGFDAVVMGHVHAQVHERYPGGELIVIGDWLDLRSYVRLQAGVFTPGRWQE
jgi:UDP-2,3-diacylglucosamine pyrophosphatase LpxH